LRIALQVSRKSAESDTVTLSGSHSPKLNINRQSNPFDVDEFKDYLRQQENEIAKLITNVIIRIASYLIY
jgi:hypothetical protein